MIDSRTYPAYIRRRRECAACGVRYTTREYEQGCIMDLEAASRLLDRMMHQLDRLAQQYRDAGGGSAERDTEEQEASGPQGEGLGAAGGTLPHEEAAPARPILPDVLPSRAMPGTVRLAGRAVAELRYAAHEVH